MFIFYKKPNILTLPYVLDGKPLRFSFIPGKNEIHPEHWKAIAAQHKARIENSYNRFMSVFKPETTDPKTGIEVGTEIIDLTNLSVNEMLDLVGATMKAEELIEYEVAEKLRKTPRKSVLKAIKQKRDEIEEFEEKLKKKD